MRSEINERREGSIIQCDIIESRLKDTKEISLIEKTFSLSKIEKKRNEKASKFNFLYGSE